MNHYELRDAPDDLPVWPFHDHKKQAEAAAYKRTCRSGEPVLIYHITEHGEKYIGSVTQ